jgi:Protein of unknown function (DUF3592)
VALRLVLGILAVTFVPLGVVFTVLGLTVDEVDRGSPEAFVYLGIPILVVGLALAGVFLVLWRKERARRARRRAGLRARAEIVSADVNWSVRVNGRPALKLTVSFAPAGEVSGTFLAGGDYSLRAGDAIEVLYDPAEPANFEPAPLTAVRR